MNAATAQLVTLTGVPPKELETMAPAIGAAVSTITSNLPEMSKDVRVIATLMEDEAKGDELLDAARRLCKAFSDLLKAAEPTSKASRPQLLNSAGRVGEASQAVLATIGEEEEYDKETADILLAIAKHVANAAASLVLKAKDVASKCDDTDQAKVIDSATQCALATSQLVTTAKVVAPTIQNPSCQKQLTEACKEVARAVENVLKACQLSCKDPKLLLDLREAAAAVTRALNELLDQVRLYGSHRAKKVTENDGAVDTIIDATDKLFSSTGDAGEMVKQAKVLASATSQLVTDIKGKAGTQPDSDIQKRLLAAARVLADATSRLMDAAKGCATNPHDSKSQAALKKAAEDVVNATNTAVSNALRKKVINRLEVCARQTAAAATQNIAAIHGSGSHNSNRILHDELELICTEVSDSMPSVVSGIKDIHSHPDDPVAQIQLINACEAFIEPTSRMANASKAAIPNIIDPSCSLSLRNSAQELDEAISELKVSLTKAQEACYTSFEIENAIEAVKELITEVDANKKAAARGNLKPLPGETIERCITQLSVDCKTVGSGMAELLTAASQGNEVHVGAASRDTTIALRDMTRSVRGVAATSNDPDFQVRTLQNSRDVLEKSIELFQETKWALENMNDKERQPRLTFVAKNVSNALNNCMNSMPGQRDIDEAIRTISESNTLFSSVTSVSSSTKKSYADLSNNLIAAANRLNESAAEIVANSKSSVNLSSASKRFTTVFGSFATSGLEMVAGIKDESIKKSMVSSLHSISSGSSKLLLSARSVASDPHSLSAKNTLGSSQRSLNDSINNLINLCSTAAPGQKEIDAAIRRIQMARPLLENPVEPVNSASYFDCLDTIVEYSHKLRDIMTNIGNSAEKCDTETFCNSVRDGADSICGLIETSAQSAYLIAAADASSVAGRPGLVDISAFHKSNDAITEACFQLSQRSSSQQQILTAATAIARHTSSLCNACRLASSKTTNPIAKRHFVQSAKDVANATAALVKEIKSLDSQPHSEVVRKLCAEATKPLIDAVQNLTAFASSDEFAGIPARISDKARLAQLPITSPAKQTCDSFCNLLNTSKVLILNPQDGPSWTKLSSNGESVDSSIASLIAALREAAPGQKECDIAIEKLRRNIRELDSSGMSLMNQTLSTRADHSFKTYREILHSTINEIADKIDPLRVTGKCEAESLGHRVTAFSAYFDPLIDNTIGAVSKVTNGRVQSNLLSQTKTVCECGLQMLFAVKEAGGNAKNTSSHADIDEAGECLKEAINDLSHTLQTTSPGAAHVPVVVDSISKSIGRMDERYSFSGDLIDPSLSFVDYQTRMVNILREINRIAQEINTKSVNKEVDQLSELTNNLATNYSNLTLNTIGAIGTTSNYEVGNRIKSSVQELGSACIQLTKATGPVQDDPDDFRAQKDVTEQTRNVSEKASYVLAALQAGSRGTQACINAASVVSGIIGDLDTTIMFATAGTLNPEDPNDTFAAHRESILKCAKALVEDTKALFVGAASDQEKLADAAGNAVEAIVKLSEEVKQGATSLGSKNSEAQVLLLNSAKDVATALGDLVLATKSASGKSNDDPTMISMKESAKHMISNVTSLLKTVKTVEDEHQRGTRALEQTIEAINQEIRLFDTSGPPNKHSTPEDLVRITKPVSISTAKAVAAGNSGRQDDIIAAANMGRKAIFDLLVTTKQAAFASESGELTSRTLEVGRGCALKYRQLLQMVRQCIQRASGATSEEKQILIEMSRDIASSVTEIVSCAEMLKGSDWVDPDDPTVIAETELLGAAASIDAAAKKLASLQPRRTSIKLPHEDMNFDEMILEAAKSITSATAALLRAACAAQRELVAAGRLSNHPVSRSDDGEWSEGLISAARMVAAATHSLVEAANALVQGHASEEKLISAAKQVAASTAHLLVACQVKADPDSKTMLRLQAAGNAVKKATDNLVRAAQRAIEADEETSLVISNRKVPSIAQEISAREEILRKERELHEARDKLAAIHKARYNQKGREYYDLSYSS
uniref:I/LWEQ domain-containing protein n=2 Tax=Tetranychus urticae TaxID=32264 RepID=T1K2Z5_TETUR